MVIPSLILLWLIRERFDRMETENRLSEEAAIA